MLPMMFIDDCLRSVVEFMETPDAKLKMRTYNVTAMSFTPDQIITEVRKFVPELKVTYEIDGRQAIGNYEFITRHLLPVPPFLAHFDYRNS